MDAKHSAENWVEYCSLLLEETVLTLWPRMTSSSRMAPPHGWRLETSADWPPLFTQLWEAEQRTKSATLNFKLNLQWQTVKTHSAQGLNDRSTDAQRNHIHQGVRREVFEGGSPNPAGGLGGAVRLRTPVSLSFLSQRCYTKIDAIFFIHSDPHHFQLNEVVPNHTLWYQKSQCQRIAQFWVLFFTCTMRLVSVLNFGNSSSLWPKAKISCSQSYPHALSASPTVGSLYMHAWLTHCIHPEMMPSHTDVAPGQASLQQVDCERSAASTIFPSDSSWTFKTGPKCSTLGEWDPYPATQAA